MQYSFISLLCVLCSCPHFFVVLIGPVYLLACSPVSQSTEFSHNLREKDIPKLWPVGGREALSVERPSQWGSVPWRWASPRSCWSLPYRECAGWLFNMITADFYSCTSIQFHRLLKAKAYQKCSKLITILPIYSCCSWDFPQPLCLHPEKRHRMPLCGRVAVSSLWYQVAHFNLARVGMFTPAPLSNSKSASFVLPARAGRCFLTPLFTLLPYCPTPEFRASLRPVKKVPISKY